MAKLDSIFKQKLGKHERQPSPEAWKRIASQLPPQPKRRGPWLAVWLMAGSFAAFGGWYGLNYMQKQPLDAQQIQQKTDKQAIIVAQPELPTTAPLPIAPVKPAIAVVKATPKKTAIAILPTTAAPIATEIVAAMQAAEAEFAHTAIKTAPIGPMAQLEEPKQFHYRIEITIPYEINKETESTTEPKGRAIVQKLLHNVLAD